MFLGVLCWMIGGQFFIVCVGGDFSKTVMLSGSQFGWSILLALGTWPLGFLMRYIPPFHENPASFFGYDMPN